MNTRQENEVSLFFLLLKVNQAVDDAFSDGNSCKACNGNTARKMRGKAKCWKRVYCYMDADAGSPPLEVGSRWPQSHIDTTSTFELRSKYAQLSSPTSNLFRFLLLWTILFSLTSVIYLICPPLISKQLSKSYFFLSIAPLPSPPFPFHRSFMCALS